MNKIIDYYNTYDEWGRLEREPAEFQVNWHFIKKYLPDTGHILDNGAGPGKYSMRLAETGFKVTLAELTPKLVEIAEAKARKLGLLSKFNDFLVADAIDLGKLQDEQFDASLMLGPMYHLQEEDKRRKAIKELYRVTKKDGIIFTAFMSREKHILSSLQHPDNWKPNNSIDTILQFDESGCFDHADAGRFTGAYFFQIEDIKPLMESEGFECLDLIGSNVASILTNENWNYWRSKGEEEVEKIIDLLIEKANAPYLLGTSSHLLYIGRKQG